MSKQQIKASNEHTYFTHLQKCNFAIVKTMWNRDMVDKLQDGIFIGFKKHLGIDFSDNHNNAIFNVPGAVELPLMLKKLADKKCMDKSSHLQITTNRYLPGNKFDLIFALGVVVKGETPHFDYVCQSVVMGMSLLSIHSQVPNIFGLLTLDNEEQAEKKLLPIEQNKGVEFALSAFYLLDELVKVNLLK